MKYFQKYNYCIYCGSSKLKKEKNQIHPKNFYVDAIKSDLNLSQKQLNNITVHRCLNCNILQNNPWFKKEISRRIYSNIYGQHNRSWTNLINFVKNNKLPNHGDLYKILSKNIKIKNYAEYNSPFMGLFLNFFKEEYKNNKLFYKNLSNKVFDYFNFRQVAGKSKILQKKYFKKSIKSYSDILILKKKNLKKKNLKKKYLFIDNSNLFWGQNDNYKSVNSKSFAEEFLDLQISNYYKNIKAKSFDLFGIFHTLDHTFEPKKILDFALNSSKVVIIYCHADKTVNKQHLFTFTSDFVKYLNKNKINTFDLTNKIKKNFKSKELYFICSRQKTYLNKFKKSFEKKIEK